ncbi:glycerophosphocholine cholinephosphodiesterase ENPP6-like [Babylonia areolata]|uniref:glycerophosphocholine cholinephosphodiesterase ENPP6-like n=1 Tax=Babylonia areolata TaxID=304850 RepID=UPI003FD59FEA
MAHLPSSTLLPLLSTTAAFFLVLLAHALAEVEYQVTFDDHVRPHQRLLLLLLDGFRYDYLDQEGVDFPGFRKVVEKGSRPEYLIPDFPTLSYPNYYSFMTGLHTERHGMTANYMYDVKRKESFLIGKNPEQFHSHWWDGGEPLWVTAEKQARTCHLYYWPGCEVEIRGTYPTFCRPYRGMPDMSGFRDAITKSLEKLTFRRTDVAGIYFELTDSLGHRYGPGSQRLMEIISDLDPIMGYLADSLENPALSDVNLMVVSDHGMTPVSRHRVIDLTNVISRHDYDSMMTQVAFASIYTKPGRTREVYEQLKGFHPNLTVYRKSDLPDRWHYKHGRYVAPLTAVADLGWFILSPDNREFPVRREDGLPMEGWHGYDNNNRDMMGLFLGMGPAFQRNATSPPIKIVDLYQIMCSVLDIRPSPHSGSWARVLPIVTFDVTSLPASSAVTSFCLLHSLAAPLLMGLFKNQEDFFDRLITQDETWVHRSDPETKAQSKHFDSPPLKKERVQPLAGMVIMLTVFCGQNGVVMMDFLANATTITGAYYTSLLQKLQEAIKAERRGMLTKGVRLQQDNTPVHILHVVLTEARSCGSEILAHPLTLPTSHHLTFTSFQP